MQLKKRLETTEKITFHENFQEFYLISLHRKTFLAFMRRFLDLLGLRPDALGLGLIGFGLIIVFFHH